MSSYLAGMPKYEAYKDSGVEWLEDVPEHWFIKRLKYISSIKTGEKDTVHRVDGGPYPFFIRSPQVQRIDTYSYDGEAVLTAGDGDIGKIFHYINGKFDYHQRVYKFSDFKGVAGKYLYYYLHYNLAEEVIKLSAKTTVDSLRLPFLQNFVVALPPVVEQTAIAAFLDRKTAQIEQAVAIKEQQIALLKERKQILIQNAVTRGLNPDVPLRDSGVEWIGEIPAHWEAMKFKYCCRVVSGQVDPRKEPYSSMPLIAPNHIESSTGRLLGLESASDQGADSGKYQLKSGDIVYSKIRPALRKACISPVDGLCSADMYVLEPFSIINKKYFLNYILTDAFTLPALDAAMRVAMPKVNREALSDFPIIVPPIEEQLLVVSHIETESAKIDKAIDLQKQQIDRLKEYKATLINSAVTGKIKVTGVVEPQQAAMAS